MGRALKNSPGLEPFHEFKAFDRPTPWLGPFFNNRALSLPKNTELGALSLIHIYVLYAMQKQMVMLIFG